MKSNVENTNDWVEVLDVSGASYARVRIREYGTTWSTKASVFLEAEQLEEFAQECLAMAKRLRGR